MAEEQLICRVAELEGLLDLERQRFDRLYAYVLELSKLVQAIGATINEQLDEGDNANDRGC